MAEVHTLEDYRDAQDPEAAAVDVRPAPGLREQHMGELVKELTEQAGTLVRQELELARLEMTEKARATGMGAGLMGGGGMVAYLGLGALTAAAILGLSEVFVTWLAALVVGGVYLLIALVLFFVGRSSVRKAGSPMPEETVQTIREDAEWIKQKSRSGAR